MPASSFVNRKHRPRRAWNTSQPDGGSGGTPTVVTQTILDIDGGDATSAPSTVLVDIDGGRA